MTLSYHRHVLVAALLTSSSLVMAQEEPRYEAAPDWVEASPLPAVSADDKNVLLLLDNQIKVENDRQISFSDTAYHVVSAQMLSQAGTINVEWQPDVQDAVIHSIDIIRGDQVIDALNGGRNFDILRRETELDQLSINGVLTASMQLTDLRIGDVVRVCYSVISSDPALDGNAAGLQGLPVAPLMIDQYRFRLLWPDGKSLEWNVDDAVTIEETQHNGLKEILFEGILPKQKDQPEHAPARFTRPPLINYTTFADWESVSRSVSKLYEERVALDADGALAGRAAAIAAEHDGKVSQMAAAVELVQSEIRYLYKGMDFGNYRPQAPDETWEKRYGDCKAKSLMLLALLRELDIDAEPMLVNSEGGDVIADLLPGLYAFDHVVVRAHIDGTDYWLDGTTQGTRMENISDTPNFHLALPLTKTGSALVDVPVRPLSEPTQIVATVIDLSAGIGFPALVDVTMTLTGEVVPLIKAAQGQLDKASFDDRLDEIIASAGNGGVAIARNVRFEDGDQVAVLTGRTIQNYHWEWKDRRYQTNMNPPVESFSFEADRSRAAWSDIPIIINHPQYQVTTVELVLPDEGAPFTLTGQSHYDGVIGGIEFVHDYELSGNKLTGNMLYRSVAAELPASELPQIRTAVARAKADKLRLQVPKNIESKTIAVHLGAREGRAEPLRMAYAEAIAQAEPEELDPYRNRASFLAGIGDYESAADDLERILAVEPNVDDYIWHSTLLEIDDPERALQSLEEARKLEPSSSTVMVRMAEILWLHDRPEDMLSAADEFESLGVEKTDADIVRSAALAQAGREDEALALLDAAFENKPGDAELYRARCRLKAQYGVALDSALKDCTRATEVSEDSYSALEFRGLAYWRLGRNDAAVEDWQSALLTNPDASHARYFLGMAAGGRDGARQQELAIMIDPELPLEVKNWKLGS